MYKPYASYKYLTDKFEKKDVRENYLLKFRNMTNGTEVFYLVQSVAVRVRGGVNSNSMCLIDQYGETVKLSCMNDNGNIDKLNLVLTEAYSQVLWACCKHSTIDLFNSTQRECLYKKDIVFMTTQEALDYVQQVALRNNKQVVII